MNIFDTLTVIVYGVGLIIAIPLVVKVFLLSKQLADALKDDPNWRNHI
jgi:hypothetical protein